jgi:predicted transcriptional regulator
MARQYDDTVMIRMDHGLKARLQELAHADRRPLANLARAVLEQFAATQTAERQHDAGAAAA